MREKTKDINIGDNRYQLCRFDAPMGAWIASLLTSTLISPEMAQEAALAPTLETSPVELSPEEKENAAKDTVLAIWLTAGAKLSEQVYRRVQNLCLMHCRKYITNTPDATVEVMTANCKWGARELEHDSREVNRLINEVLQFNLSSFFLESVSSSPSGEKVSSL